MHRVAVRIVTCRQAPARFAITLVSLRIADAMRTIDLYMAHALFPVVGVSIFEIPGIEPAKRVVTKEQRSAKGRAQRQDDPKIRLAVYKMTPGGKPTGVDARVDSVTRRGCRQHIGEQAFVPAANFLLMHPPVDGAPQPIKDTLAALCVPVPL